MGPSSSPSEVAQNNYDGKKSTWERKVDQGKTDVVFAVKLPKESVRPCNARGRDVHLYEGDLKLDTAKEVDVYVRGKDGLQKFSHKK